jgi:uncharacterized paraquat-inducible protein A
LDARCHYTAAVIERPSPQCPRCQGPLISRNRAQLSGVGILLCATPALALLVPLLWFPAIILFLAGAYLVVWATLGRGRWCRQCKSFPTGAP